MNATELIARVRELAKIEDVTLGMPQYYDAINELSHLAPLLANALERALAEREWKPIETAPKGTIIGWSAGLGVNLWYWDDQKYHQNPRPLWIAVGPYGATYSRQNQPTLWQPIPNPPTK